MHGLNHTKVNFQKRVARECRPQKYYINRRGPFLPISKGWLKVRFGKHYGQTLPEIFFRDPTYFFRELIWKKRIQDETDYGKELAMQARRVLHRAKHIRAPRPCVEFAICRTDDGTFRRLQLLKSQKDGLTKLKKKYASSEAVSVLDLQKLFWTLKSDHERERLVRDLKRIFFRDEGNLTADECGRFFSRSANFA